MAKLPAQTNLGLPTMRIGSAIIENIKSNYPKQENIYNILFLRIAMKCTNHKISQEEHSAIRLSIPDFQASKLQSSFQAPSIFWAKFFLPYP